MSPCCHCAASSACSCQQMHGKKQLPPVSSFLTFTVISVMRLPLGVFSVCWLIRYNASYCCLVLLYCLFRYRHKICQNIYQQSTALEVLCVCTLPVSKSLLPSTNSCITSNSMPLQAPVWYVLCKYYRYLVRHAAWSYRFQLCHITAKRQPA